MKKIILMILATLLIFNITLLSGYWFGNKVGWIVSFCITLFIIHGELNKK